MEDKFYVVTTKTSIDRIFNCWTALDTEGTRGPVYANLDESSIENLRSSGYTVEQVSLSQVDQKGF